MNNQENGSPSKKRLHLDDKNKENDHPPFLVNEKHSEECELVSSWESNPINNKVIRLIGQYLAERGFHSTLEKLNGETKGECPHIATSLDDLTSAILEGAWPQAFGCLEKLSSSDEFQSTALQQAMFDIGEQQFLEQVERRDYSGAVDTLQKRLRPGGIFENRVAFLNSLLGCPTIEEFRKLSKWPGSGKSSRQKLMQRIRLILAPTLRGRLECLLRKGWQWEKEQCLASESIDDIPKDVVFDNYSNPLADLPAKNTMMFEEFADDVLACEFSPNGHHLATGCADGILQLWKIEGTQFVKVILGKAFHVQGGVGLIAWSNDSRLLIACSEESDMVLLVDIVAESGTTITADWVFDMRLTWTGCCWCPSRQSFLLGTLQGPIYELNKNGQLQILLQYCPSQGIAAYDPDGFLIIIGGRLRLLYFDQLTAPVTLLSYPYSFTSLSVNTVTGLVALAVFQQGLLLYDLNQRRSLNPALNSALDQECVSRCQLGGRNGWLVACGSEDGTVCLWSTESGAFLRKLVGHQARVNSVSFHPNRPMLASVSDDLSLRIWEPVLT